MYAHSQLFHNQTILWVFRSRQSEKRHELLKRREYYGGGLAIQCLNLYLLLRARLFLITAVSISGSSFQSITPDCITPTHLVSFLSSLKFSPFLSTSPDKLLPPASTCPLLEIIYVNNPTWSDLTPDHLDQTGPLRQTTCLFPWKRELTPHTPPAHFRRHLTLSSPADTLHQSCSEPLIPTNTHDQPVLTSINDILTL